MKTRAKTGRGKGVLYIINKSYISIVFIDNYLAFIVWANDELEYFVSKFSRQVFHCDITLNAIGICIGIATRHCDKVGRRYHNFSGATKSIHI